MARLAKFWTFNKALQNYFPSFRFQIRHHEQTSFIYKCLINFNRSNKKCMPHAFPSLISVSFWLEWENNAFYLGLITTNRDSHSTRVAQRASAIKPGINPSSCAAHGKLVCFNTLTYGTFNTTKEYIATQKIVKSRVHDINHRLQESTNVCVGWLFSFINTVHALCEVPTSEIKTIRIPNFKICDTNVYCNEVI